MGVICGSIIGLWAQFMIAREGPPAFVLPVTLAVIVGTALFAAMTFAAVFGAAVPLVLNRLRVDPAVASGPFVTITNDISALLIYFGVTLTMVRTLSGPVV
jgi:Mg/Co/Ni transporter MgtE